MGLALDEPEGNEAATVTNGIAVLISEEVTVFAEGKTIDYVDQPYQKGFIIGIPGYSSC